MYDEADSLAFTFADVEALASNLGTYDAATKRLTVEGVVFDLNDQADAGFFAELSFVHSLVARLKTDERLKTLVADKASDFFTFAFNFGVRTLRFMYALVISANFSLCSVLSASTVSTRTRSPLLTPSSPPPFPSYDLTL